MLVTWQGCPLQVDDVTMTAAGAAVRFASVGDCYADPAWKPYTTIIELPESRPGDVRFTLTLTGDGHDGEIEVEG